LKNKILLHRNTFRAVIRHFKSLGDREGEAASLCVLAGLNLAHDDPDQALKAVRQSLLLYKSLSDRKAEAHAMQMLICCHLVKAEKVEKEELSVRYVRTCLISMIEACGLNCFDDNFSINQEMFALLMEMPGAAKMIQEIGVDVVGLADFVDFVCEEGVTLEFEDMMEMMMQMRGTNLATVKDIVDLRKFLLTELSVVDEKLDQVMDYVSSQQAAVGGLTSVASCRPAGASSAGKVTMEKLLVAGLSMGSKETSTRRSDTSPAVGQNSSNGASKFALRSVRSLSPQVSEESICTTSPIAVIAAEHATLGVNSRATAVEHNTPNRLLKSQTSNASKLIDDVEFYFTEVPAVSQITGV